MKTPYRQLFVGSCVMMILILAISWTALSFFEPLSGVFERTTREDVVTFFVAAAVCSIALQFLQKLISSFYAADDEDKQTAVKSETKENI